MTNKIVTAIAMTKHLPFFEWRDSSGRPSRTANENTFFKN